jgi:hypothetical protein
MRKIFQNKKPIESEEPQAAAAPNAVMGNDSLIKFYPKRNAPKIQ